MGKVAGLAGIALSLCLTACGSPPEEPKEATVGAVVPSTTTDYHKTSPTGPSEVPKASNASPAELTSSAADARAKEAYQAYLDGKPYAEALAEAKASRYAPVVAQLIEAGKREGDLMPGTASAEKAWRASVDPAYEKALDLAFEAGSDAVRLVKAAAVKSARANGQEDRAREWESMPEVAVTATQRP